LKIGFITERQLEQGAVTSAPILFVPNVAHLSDAAFGSLSSFKGKIVSVGDNKPLAKNEYNEERSQLTALSDPIPFTTNQTKWRDIWSALPARLEGIKPLIDVRDENGQRVWGVPWRCAKTDDCIIINLYNARREPVTLTLDQPCVNLLTGQRIDGKFTLQPMEVRICRAIK
jgi:hypothetical protein